MADILYAYWLHTIVWFVLFQLQFFLFTYMLSTWYFLSSVEGRIVAIIHSIAMVLTVILGFL